MNNKTLPLRGIPAALNSDARHAGFSRSAQSWLQVLKRAPATVLDLQALTTAADERLAADISRENGARMTWDVAEQVRFREAINRLDREAETRQPVKKAATGTGAQQGWAVTWLREWKPLERVLGGAREKGLTALEVTEGNKLPFTPLDLVRAMKNFNAASVPGRSNAVLSKTLREGYPGFRWAQGHGGTDREALQGPLLEAYFEGKILDDDNLLDDHSTPLKSIRR